ncbi:MAG: O-antigen ligase family protein [Planctomycetota bacterium]|nr:O-antigen ligase family protein [Planctomycetota bacterium]
MIELTRRKTEPVTQGLLSQNAASGGLLGIVLVLALAVVVAAVAWPATMPWSFLALAGGAVLLYWSVRWEITLWAWIWVLSYGLLDWPQWRIESSAFFTMTVPRFIFLVAMLAFGFYFLLHKERLRYDRAVIWVMLAFLVYCAISATITGWVAATMPSPARGAPYFRFLGPIFFPFLIFFCVYNCTRDEKQIRRLLILLSIYGWYALYIGYLQYAAIRGLDSARSLIWPAYINDPNLLLGHHFDRARGAFYASNPQANLLLLLFYADLFLIRRMGVPKTRCIGFWGSLRGPYRIALIIQAVLIPPAIFFTGLRAAYLSFAVCGIVWCLWGCKGRLGKTKLAMAFLVAALAIIMFWGNIAQRGRAPSVGGAPARIEHLRTERATGGVAQTGPIITRMVLLAKTLDMVEISPLVGVGFGHFAEADKKINRDPTSLGARSSAVTPISTPANLFAVMAAETGIIGLSLLVAIFILIYRQSLQLYRRLPSEREALLSKDFVVVFWVAMTVYLVDATFVDILWDVPSNGLFWAFAGLMVGYNRLMQSGAQNQPDLSVASLNQE